ncbi:Two-component system response regulator DccR [hydrothermal vent metagenome]|uniref:Two-component system response regulator DccR n=1 Tax=hydrothermal vent metagenome TaxID=652676 RepID=A0A1W1EBA2_9ZZZZ
MDNTILLLEDDLQLSDTVKQFLELKGYEVYCAYDGLQAQDVAYEKHIDLMLLDVKVPLLNGFEFLKQLRAEGKEIPAIFITSLNSVENVEKGFDVGCDDYIRKPFALKEMLVRVESLMKRTYGTHEENIEIDKGLLFDIKELQLTKNKKRVPLKTKELKLLSLFLQHPNELLSYEKINEALWEYEEEPSAGSLRTYIKTLRATIGKEKIETIKNIGYRFVSQ